jgi:RHS repeat-associated protein
MTVFPNLATVNYDVQNRAVSMVTGSGTEQYAYAPGGERIWKKMPNATEEFYFHGITGRKLGTYRAATGANGYGMFVLDTNLYFGNKLIRSRGATVVTDRLGSVRASGPTLCRYFPYGEEQQVTSQDREKFDGYYRDGNTGLDFGDSRYYGNTVGASLTASRSRSDVPSTPGGWNRYAFMEGDPVGNSSGLVMIDETGRFDDSQSNVVSYVSAIPAVTTMTSVASSSIPVLLSSDNAVPGLIDMQPTVDVSDNPLDPVVTSQSVQMTPALAALYASIGVPYPANQSGFQSDQVGASENGSRLF